MVASLVSVTLPASLSWAFNLGAALRSNKALRSLSNFNLVIWTLEGLIPTWTVAPKGQKLLDQANNT